MQQRKLEKPKNKFNSLKVFTKIKMKIEITFTNVLIHTQSASTLDKDMRRKKKAKREDVTQQQQKLSSSGRSINRRNGMCFK